VAISGTPTTSIAKPSLTRLSDLSTSSLLPRAFGLTREFTSTMAHPVYGDSLHSRPDATKPANNGHTNETAARLSRKAQAYLDAQRGYKAILAAGHPETSARAIEARNIMRGAYAALTGADLGAINRQKGKV
jgi:hypothetical protein